MIAALLLAAASGAQTLEGVNVSALSRTAAASRPPAVIVDERAIGAWYRKLRSVPSAEDDGLAVSGVLPAPAFDPARMHALAPGEEPYKQGPLDSPSVYVGLSADGTELDAGLKWDHAYGPGGKALGEYAWRVFWRVRDAKSAYWRNPAPGGADDVYLLPGDGFTMSVKTAADGTVRFEVRGGGQDFAKTIPLSGLSAGGKALPRSFKRVHAIDQFREDGARRVGNEGSPALPTAANLTGGRWTSAVLLRAGRRIPLTGAAAQDVRGTDEAAAYPAVFSTAGTDRNGGERIDVTPPAPSTPAP